MAGVQFDAVLNPAETEPFQISPAKSQLLLLRLLVELKAYISLWIGKVINNSYLVKTYEKALEMAG